MGPVVRALLSCPIGRLGCMYFIRRTIAELGQADDGDEEHLLDKGHVLRGPYRRGIGIMTLHWAVFPPHVLLLVVHDPSGADTLVAVPRLCRGGTSGSEPRVRDACLYLVHGRFALSAAVTPYRSKQKETCASIKTWVSNQGVERQEGSDDMLWQSSPVRSTDVAVCGRAATGRSRLV